jgi:hypothetical protein
MELSIENIRLFIIFEEQAQAILKQYEQTGILLYPN